MAKGPTRSRRGLRVGVLGCGYWGSKHARVLISTSGVSDVSLIDSNSGTRMRLGSRMGNVRTFGSLDQALPYIDAVVIATPPSTHAPLALAAMRGAKHVLVEKPLATKTSDATCMIAQAQRSGVVLMAGHTFQYNPAVRALRDRMVGGELGEVLYIHSARLNLGLYQRDVDVVWDLAPHDVSILNYLLNLTPKAVTAWGDSLAFGGVNDLAHLRLEYGASPVMGYAHISWLDPRKTRRVTVVGSKKMAVYDDLAEERLRIYDRGLGMIEQPPSPDRPLTYRYGDIVVPHIASDEPLAVQDQHFIDSILEGRQPETNGQNGLAVVATLEAIAASMEHGNRVPIGDTPAERLSVPLMQEVA